MARIFAAIPIGGGLADALPSLMSELGDTQWTAPAKLHLTLRFAGELAADEIARLHEALSQVRSAPVPIDLDGVGSFEVGHGQGAVWAGVRPVRQLVRLRQDCESAARLAGLAADERGWLPHVTIGYVSHSSLMLVADWLRRHRQFHAGPAEASAFGMYESVRTGHAIEYRLVQSYELAA